MENMSNELLQEIRHLVKVLDKPKLTVYSLQNAADSFNVSVGFLKKGIEDGKLRHVKNGNRTYVTDEALKKFFESNTEYI